MKTSLVVEDVVVVVVVVDAVVVVVVVDVDCVAVAIEAWYSCKLNKDTIKTNERLKTFLSKTVFLHF